MVISVVTHCLDNLIYVFLYQNLNKREKNDFEKVSEIYVFLYQNLNKKEEIIEVKVESIYVFLYQNLNAGFEEKIKAIIRDLCISILEFKC